MGEEGILVYSFILHFGNLQSSSSCWLQCGKERGTWLLDANDRRHALRSDSTSSDHLFGTPKPNKEAEGLGTQNAFGQGLRNEMC